MKEVKGSQTERNLYLTFAGESRARNRYNFFSEVARLEGYQWIGDVFDEAAGTKYAHSREVYRRYLDMVGNTLDNLKEAMEGETMEYSTIYRQYEEEARKEGFHHIGDFFKELSQVARNYEEKFEELYNRVKNDNVFRAPVPVAWRCMNCGYTHIGTSAPNQCSLCKFPKNFFKVEGEEL